MKTNKYVGLKVSEETRKLAKELSAKAGLPLKDYVKEALEMSKDANFETRKTRKKQQVMGFELRF